MNAKFMATATKASPKQVAGEIVDRFGRTFAEELGIHVKKNNAQELFKLLCFAMLSGIRIGHRLAMAGVKALFDQGWTTPQEMLKTTWRQRTDVLNHSGYARYDESTSRKLEAMSQLLMDKYGGDLRQLREAAEHDAGGERELLKEIKGIGEVGADIFFREVQAAWDEVFPFLDALARRVASRLNLPADPDELVKLVGREDYVRLVAGLVRVHLDKQYESLAG